MDWKALIVGAMVTAAAIYGGPAAGRAVGLVAPVVVSKVADVVTPGASSPVAKGLPAAAEAPKSNVPGAPKVSTPLRDKLYRATLKQVAHDFGIKGRLDCRVVEK